MRPTCWLRIRIDVGAGFRKLQLQRSPLCVLCKAEGKVVAAEVVDHVERHGGDVNRFWNTQNLQSLCVTCHDQKTRDERRPFARGCDEFGWPLDPRHPCYIERA